MTEQEPRGVLPIRLNRRERALAVAIASMGAGRVSAGQGVREALLMAEAGLRAAGQGERLSHLVETFYAQFSESER